jgi:hypothetical protein
MARIATFHQILEKMQQLEGRRVALEAAADLLEREHAATDFAAAKTPLRCEVLFGSVLPEKIVLATAMDLRRQAQAAEHERTQLERSTVNLRGVEAEAADPADGTRPRRDSTPSPHAVRLKAVG